MIHQFYEYSRFLGRSYDHHKDLPGCICHNLHIHYKVLIVWLNILQECHRRRSGFGWHSELCYSLIHHLTIFSSQQQTLPKNWQEAFWYQERERIWMAYTSFHYIWPLPVSATTVSCCSYILANHQY